MLCCFECRTMQKWIAEWGQKIGRREAHQCPFQIIPPPPYTGILFKFKCMNIFEYILLSQLGVQASQVPQLYTRGAGNLTR